MTRLHPALRPAVALAVAAVTFFGFTQEPPPTAPVSAVDGLAISGYDPVAYFTESRARLGAAEFEHAWNGARWRFATAANLAAFVEAPAKYAPQYGGYCAWAVSRNYTYPADPQAWRIVGGRLFLNYDKQVQATWAQELEANIARADANWPGVLAVREAR